MVSRGTQAPTFTAPVATGDVEEFDLAAAIETEAPVVLAFFPAAFTGTCTHEMNEFQHRLEDFAEHGANVYGVSVDLPWALNEFRDQLGLSFGLISDTDRRILDAYDLATDFGSSGVYGVAKRAVVVVDGDGRVAYAWVSDDPGVEPDYDEVEAAVAAAA